MEGGGGGAGNPPPQAKKPRGQAEGMQEGAAPGLVLQGPLPQDVVIKMLEAGLTAVLLEKSPNAEAIKELVQRHNGSGLKDMCRLLDMGSHFLSGQPGVLLGPEEPAEESQRARRSREIRLFHAYVLQRESEAAARRDVEKLLRKLLKDTLHPSAVLVRFGSAATDPGCASFISDVDLSVIWTQTIQDAALQKRNEAPSWHQSISGKRAAAGDDTTKPATGAAAEKALDIIILTPLFKSLQKLLWLGKVVVKVELRRRARVVIINVRFINGVEVDIAVKRTTQPEPAAPATPEGLAGQPSATPDDGTALLHELVAAHSRDLFLPLAVTLKMLCFMDDVDQPYTRGLGSFSLYLLLAAYLTRARAGLVASLPADPMLSDYLLGFLKTYSAAGSIPPIGTKLKVLPDRDPAEFIASSTEREKVQTAFADAVKRYEKGELLQGQSELSCMVYGPVMETYRSMSVELSNRSLAEQPMSAVQYNTKAQQLYTLVRDTTLAKVGHHMGLPTLQVLKQFYPKACYVLSKHLLRLPYNHLWYFSANAVLVALGGEGTSTVTILPPQPAPAAFTEGRKGRGGRSQAEMRRRREYKKRKAEKRAREAEEAASGSTDSTDGADQNQSAA